MPYPPGMTDAHWAYLDGADDDVVRASDTVSDFTDDLKAYFDSLEVEGILVIELEVKDTEIDKLKVHPSIKTAEMSSKINNEIVRIEKKISQRYKESSDGASFYVDELTVYENEIDYVGVISQ